MRRASKNIIERDTLDFSICRAFKTQIAPNRNESTASNRTIKTNTAGGIQNSPGS